MLLKGGATTNKDPWKSATPYCDDEITLLPLRGDIEIHFVDEEVYNPTRKVTRLFSGWKLLQLCVLAAFVSVPLHIYFRICSPLLGFITYSALALPFALLVFFTSTRREYTASLFKPSPYKTSATLSLSALVYLLGTAFSLVVWTSILGSLILPSGHGVSLRIPSSSAGVSAPNLLSDHSIFFAVNLYNSQHVIPTMQTALLQLSAALGNQNVFISIYESNSSDNTCEQLKALREKLGSLGIPHSIRCGQHYVRHGKVDGETTGYSRVKYLAAVRNEALAPLDHPKKLIEAGVGPFTHVAWLNDIFFDPQDVITLLNTHGGDFDQACAIDTVPLGFYDTWVTRDVREQRLKPLWPYFSSEEDIASIRAEEPILVNSCWNGMTIFDASWFTTHSRRPLLLQPSASVVAREKYNATLPIRFRYQEAPHCVASECLLTSYDQHLFSAPHRPRIYVNPKVVVSYDSHTLALYHVWSRWWVSKLWLYVWQDLISTRLFGSVTDWGRKQPRCAEELHLGWARLDAPLRPLAPLILSPSSSSSSSSTSSSTTSVTMMTSSTAL